MTQSRISVLILKKEAVIAERRWKFDSWGWFSPTLNQLFLYGCFNDTDICQLQLIYLIVTVNILVKWDIKCSASILNLQPIVLILQYYYNKYCFSSTMCNCFLCHGLYWFIWFIVCMEWNQLRCRLLKVLIQKTTHTLPR